MYVDDVEIFANNVKELEIMIPKIRKYSSDIGMGFSSEKYVIVIVKSGKR